MKNRTIGDYVVNSLVSIEMLVLSIMMWFTFSSSDFSEGYYSNKRKRIFRNLYLQLKEQITDPFGEYKDNFVDPDIFNLVKSRKSLNETLIEDKMLRGSGFRLKKVDCKGNKIDRESGSHFINNKQSNSSSKEIYRTEEIFNSTFIDQSFNNNNNDNNIDNQNVCIENEDKRNKEFLQFSEVSSNKKNTINEEKEEEKISINNLKIRRNTEVDEVIIKMFRTKMNQNKNNNVLDSINEEKLLPENRLKELSTASQNHPFIYFKNDEQDGEKRFIIFEENPIFFINKDIEQC